MVAVGTSLPELATVIVAALRRHPEIAIGGVLGSNIFHILAVLGIASLIETIPVDPAFVAFDYWVMLAAALILIPVVLSRNRISRLESSLMLLAYLAYVAALYAPGEIRFASGSPL